MEIVDIQDHPRGGYIVTIQDGKNSREFLRRSASGTLGNWYTWPEIQKLSPQQPYWDAWERYHLLQEYNPPPLKTYKAKAKGNPNRCMFCHTSMSGLSAQCMACGGAMHLACADEVGDKCVTPGCSASEPAQDRSTENTEEKMTRRGWLSRLFS